ncbi:ABC transporter substrate-binding protein [Peterkaempfera bronchialis]|uniref:Extracellular solute-binding protein n=1 Tax=Peterkaempfera bronchialis TaxID=2126346 RepID=A0A345SVB1_9ACTN|nr:extracellular solute-binding protein [Peterkaempfera bronchialis]AXI77666.1 extracellular solute-binding protein [Peterkaempfera bronchialis]
MRTTSSLRGRRTTLAAVAGLATCAALVTGCSSSNSDNKGGDTKDKGNAQITLRIGTFGDFGFDNKTGAKLYAEYESLHPNIKIVSESNTDGGKYWDALKLHLASGSGVDDIQAIEVGYIAEATGKLYDKFVDLSKAPGIDSSAWVDYKWKQATTAGGQTIGLGTDVGPMAICYRTDLFKAAGLPTDRDEVAKLWEGDWNKYLQAGETFKKKSPSGAKWVDSAGGIFNAVVSSQPDQYSNAQGELVYKDSPGVKLAWDTAVKAISEGLSTGLQQFDDGGSWAAGFKNNKFATISCPSWMTGIITSNAGPEGKGKWDIAKAPVAANWGGSFLAVPKAGKNQEEAIKLAAWLTAPEQQAKVFAKFGNIPSTKAGLDSPEVQNTTQEYFNNAPTGKIYADIAKSVTPAPIGPWDGQVKDIITKNGLLDIEQNHKDPVKAWEEVVKAVTDKTDN